MIFLVVPIMGYGQTAGSPDGPNGKTDQGSGTMRSEINIKWIVFAPALFTPADPSHRTDIGKPFTGRFAPVVIAPVAAVGILLIIKPGLLFVLF